MLKKNHFCIQAQTSFYIMIQFTFLILQLKNGKKKPLQSFVSYHEYNSFQQNNKDKNKKSQKYRSPDNYRKVKDRIRKVMRDVSRIKMLSNNDELEQKIVREVVWDDEPKYRKNTLKNL